MNKKLIKTIVSITCGLGIASSIPFAVTSCGCSQEKINPLPDTVYKYDETDPKKLVGFTNEFLANQTAYDMYDAIEIPARVTEIANDAFYVNSTSTIPPFITKLTFARGSNCSLISYRSFVRSSLISIDFSKATNLKEISLLAFGSNDALVSIDLSKCINLTTIDVNAFWNCSSLTSASLPNSLTALGEGVFHQCSALRSINFPRNLNSIGNIAFSYCSSLTSVTFPSSLSTIGENVFNDCSNLISITWNAWKGPDQTNLQPSSFSGVCPKGGNVIVKNPKDGNNSEVLLEYLLNNGGLPSGGGWIAVN